MKRDHNHPAECESVSEFNWNFDAVPDKELVACCYWEYARESAFIRDVRRRCLDPKSKEMMNGEIWEYWGKDVERIQSIGYPAEVFLRGFFFDEQEDRRPSHPDAPRITGSFPNPWQSLSAGERKERSQIRNDIAVCDLQAFKRAHWSNAWDLMKRAKSRQHETIAANNEAHTQHPGVSEYRLRQLGILKNPPEGLSIFWADDADKPNKEVTMVEIEWGNFTNEEIIQCFRKWVGANRPKEVRKPDQRGHKPKDWRADLRRLAVMRLLGRFTALELVADDRFPEIWKTKQFSGRKWGDVTKWHDARREAGALFRKLFPFLPPTEKPFVWTRQPPGK